MIKLTQLKVKLFTHNDLDGIGAAVVANHVFGKENVGIEFCGYNDIDKKFGEFIVSKQIDNYNVVFITDISLKSESIIQYIDQKASDKVMLIDHHGTAEHFNKYSWARVNELEPNPYSPCEEQNSSGTSAFYQFLIESGFYSFEENTELNEFVEMVRLWDSWDWTRTSPVTEHAMLLNTLLSTIGRWKFVDRFSENPSVMFNNTERTIVDIEVRRMKYEVRKKQESLIVMDLVVPESGIYKVGVAWVSNYISEVGNELASDNPELDFIVMINGDRLSFRGIHDEIDLGEIAKHFNGGGHPKAAGGSVDKSLLEKVAKLMLSQDEN